MKTVLWIVGGSVFLVMMMIFGLTRMSGSGGDSLKVEESILMGGAKLATESGEVKVTVVNFSDMQCPACKKAHGILRGLIEKPGVRYVIRHFPLMGHRYSTNGAKAVEAARQMGKGWEMVDLLFERQEEWSAVNPREIDERLITYAVVLGMEKAEFETRFRSDETALTIASDKALGERLKLSGTPTIYVNGEQVSPEFVMGKVDELLNQ